MLRTFRQLPAGKPDMLRLILLLFGAGLHEAMSRAIETVEDPPATAPLLERHRTLEAYRERFRQHLSHLVGYARLPESSGLQMETLTGGIIEELFDDVGAHGGDADYVVRLRNKQYLIECRSSREELSAVVLDQLQALRRQHRGSKLVLIANAHSRTPLLERPESISGISGVKVISAVELLRCHNMLHLEPMPPAQARRLLLAG